MEWRSQGVEVAKVDEFKYPELTVQCDRECGKSEESAGMVEVGGEECQE